ncbi:hypothetical protein Angca_000945 [Angiostrongylus cantonensis]|nr:hypothetical protein Angca_000945 [Angiostrongylus cantonensis]
MADVPPSLADLPKIPSEIASAVMGKVELKKVSTKEKNILPTMEDVTKERQHAAMLSGIENFSTDQLKHSELEEKVSLPSNEDIIQEKQHIELTQKIESFSVEQLRHAETEEKNVLPSKEDLLREKTVDMAAHFDKNRLKHVEPNVKVDVEVIDA